MERTTKKGHKNDRYFTWDTGTLAIFEIEPVSASGNHGHIWRLGSRLAHFACDEPISREMLGAAVDVLKREGWAWLDYSYFREWRGWEEESRLRSPELSEELD